MRQRIRADKYEKERARASKKLVERLKRSGLTTHQLHEQSGVPRYTISRIIYAEGCPSLYDAYDICDVLDCEVCDIFGDGRSFPKMKTKYLLPFEEKVKRRMEEYDLTFNNIRTLIPESRKVVDEIFYDGGIPSVYTALVIADMLRINVRDLW